MSQSLKQSGLLITAHAGTHPGMPFVCCTTPKPADVQLCEGLGQGPGMFEVLLKQIQQPKSTALPNHDSKGVTRLATFRQG
jgi:hypothetical protein